MKLTIGSEAIFFICLIVAYLYFWRSGNFQQQVARHLSVKSTTIFTAILMLSSFTFWKAEKNHAKQKSRATRIWLMFTIVLGFTFLSGQGNEYYKLIKENVMHMLFGIIFDHSDFLQNHFTLTFNLFFCKF